MTTPQPARAAFDSPRALAAWALVAYAAAYLAFSFFDWIMPGGGSFVGRSATAGFTNLFFMAMPIVAVVLAAHISPPLRHARLITTVALVEYTIAILLGALAWLIGFGSLFDGRIHSANDAFDSLRYVVLGLFDLGLLAVAAFVAFKAFTQLGGRLPVTVQRTPAPPPPPAA